MGKINGMEDIRQLPPKVLLMRTGYTTKGKHTEADKSRGKEAEKT